jgi:hypothetical protein
METSKLIAKNLLNGRVCDNCRYHTFEVQETVYESGKEGEIKLDECILNPELDLYGITNRYTCENWQESMRPEKSYFVAKQQIQNPVQGQLALDTKNNELSVYDGYKWTSLP